VIDFLVDVEERLAVQGIDPVIHRGAQVKPLARDMAPRQLGQLAVVHPHVPVHIKCQPVWFPLVL
jgi:hypothetical protein